MQIVIDIPDFIYNALKEDVDCGTVNLNQAIVNGTVLPKGHGRLIDANDVDNHIIGSVDLRDCPTIIEADKK